MLTKAEFVVRSYLTGVTSTSIWRAYEGGARTFCGHALPDGMKKNQKLAKPILTPSTKAEQGDHDVSASREELIAMGAISAEDFDKAAEMVHRVFAFGQELAAKLRASGKYQVVMTRDKDLFLKLRERIRAAQEAKGDLFISLEEDTLTGSVRPLALA